MEFSEILDQLEKRHGKPRYAGPTGAYEMLLHRNCGYPQSDERCDNGFRALKEHIGLKPEEILAASDRRLAKVLRESKSGMVPEKRAQRLKEIAARVQTKFGGKLEQALREPLKEARKVLKQFPTLGDSGADRILLFAGIASVAAIPATAVRVPLRIAFGGEKKNYAASYRAAQEYVAGEIPEEFAARKRAYLLLKRHGQEICREKPACEDCAIAEACAYFQRGR